MHDLAAATERILLAHGVREKRICIALSGGMDSVVLLALLRELAPRLALTISAVHVNHGLSPNAPRWQTFCESICDSQGVALAVARVHVPADSGLGLEASARRARYAAFAEQAADYVALAHHLDDQVETFLIQLLRGAGARGLSAMPVVRSGALDKAGAGGPLLLRPLLETPRSVIAQYASACGLRWVEDESNEDVSLDRNFLRREVIPRIAARFPAYRHTVARAAHNLTDAAQLADAVAQIDTAGADATSGLAIDALRELPRARALNALRYVFARQGLDPPRRRTLEEALRQCLSAGDDAQVRVDFADHSVRCYRGRVFLVRNGELPADWCRQWSGEAQLDLPQELGRIRFLSCVGTGLSKLKLGLSPVTVRGRHGGERMALGPKRPHRNLRHLFQEAGIPAWRRGRTPLVFCGTRLICVPGIGVAAEFQAQADEPAIDIVWEETPGS